MRRRPSARSLTAIFEGVSAVAVRIVDRHTALGLVARERIQTEGARRASARVIGLEHQVLVAELLGETDKLVVRARGLPARCRAPAWPDREQAGFSGLLDRID